MKNKNNEIQIVCVANNLKMFEEVVASNENMNKYQITLFDNSKENIGIAKRYNTFIDEKIIGKIDETSNFWVAFVHQDFAFTKDPLEALKKLDKNHIYGPVGVQAKFSLFKFFKNMIFQKLGYYPSFKIDFRGLNPFNDKKFINMVKTEMSSLIFRRKVCFGQIDQGQADGSFKKFGRKIKHAKDVLNLDCCCLIVHSSLINKYRLRFDENLNWHLYVEEFCINGQKNHKLKTKVVQLDCYHLGQGTLNDEFYQSVDYVVKKHNLKRLNTTCVDY